MTYDLTEHKQNVVDEAQHIAEHEFGDEPTTTMIKLWDDGDFCVEVRNGFSAGGLHQKILYRSSESTIYPGETFLYLVGTVDTSEGGTIIDMEPVDR